MLQVIQGLVLLALAPLRRVAGRVLVVPLAPARDGNPRRCRPIGCYEPLRASLT